MRKLTTSDVAPRDAYLALQREAADRYAGRPRQTLAALLIAPWFSVRIVHRFARSDFAPPPAVDVVMVRMHKRGPPLIGPGDAQLYRDLVVALFTSRKPNIGAASSQLFGGRVSRRLLHAAQLDAPSSVSAVALSGWLRLFRHFARLPSGIRSSVAGAEERLLRRQRRLEKIHRTRVPRDALASSHSALHAHERLPSHPRWGQPPLRTPFLNGGLVSGSERGAVNLLAFWTEPTGRLELPTSGLRSRCFSRSCRCHKMARFTRSAPMTVRAVPVLWRSRVRCRGQLIRAGS